MKKITSLLFFAFLGLYVNSQVIQTASVEGITEYKLKNGLKVLLFPDNSSQTITVILLIKWGLGMKAMEKKEWHIYLNIWFLKALQITQIFQKN